MTKIVNKQQLAPDIKRLDILAEHIANKILPGQFVMVTPDEKAQRIPLTVVDIDPRKGTISLIFQEVDPSTKRLGAISINETIAGLLGPLGVPAKIEKAGVVVCIATGMGAAQILPICRAYRKLGNKVIGIIGAKTKKSLVLEAQMRISCNKLLIATNDGSYIKKGLATEVLKEVLGQEKVNLVYAIGSVDMMQAVAQMTKEKGIKMLVSVNPVMVDGTGQCGSCRISVAGQTILACVDGPEFDGHQIDYQYLNIRMNAAEEKDEWHNLRSISSQKSDGSGTLTKFLLGILKNRP